MFQLFCQYILIGNFPQPTFLQNSKNVSVHGHNPQQFPAEKH